MMTNEQIEQKKQLLSEKLKEIKTIYNELFQAGAIELSEADLDKVSGGRDPIHKPEELKYPQKPKEDKPIFDPSEAIRQLFEKFPDLKDSL